MKIVLDIERLVLDGLPVTAAEADRIRRAVEGELSRLLGAGAIPARFLADGTVPSLTAPALDSAAGHAPEALGAELARSVHTGLIGTGSGNREVAARNQGKQRP
jgi:hypothetical protein